MRTQRHDLRRRSQWAAALLWLPLLLVWTWAGAEESYCAQVKIEIKQELTLERQAFDAHLRITNGLTNIAVEQVAVTVTFADGDGNPVVATSDPNDTSAAFFIRIDSMSGIADTTGSGQVAPGGIADIHWLIIPAPGTGGESALGRLYLVGATLSYTLGGEAKTVEVAPDSILVKPMPMLTLDYFLPQEVYADDAFTSAIEPPEPFALGVRVGNSGAGSARALKIESAQPRIVENTLGLLIDFRILGSAVNDTAADADLTADFGDLPAGGSSVARWSMETSLSGRFTEFTADFSHSDELGGALTSLVAATRPHLLVHDVRADLPGRDRVRDFLARDGDVLRVYESSGLDTAVYDQSAVATLVAEAQSGARSSYVLSVPATAGFLFVRLPDPNGGTKAIVQAMRADGKLLPADNIWRSRSRTGSDPWQHFINLFDANGGGSYTLVLETTPEAPQPPVLQYIPDQRIAEGRRLGFIVEASDPNGTVPTITAVPLPSGATFRDETDSELATWAFDWPVALGQAQIAPDGTYIPYEFTFTATDGVLSASQAAQILVCPAWDTDCDRMADAWELARFGTLARDGSGDFDRDGVSDLDEYLNGTETPLALRPGLNLIAYPYATPPAHADCRALLTALGATGPDDSLARLDEATGRLETCTAAAGTGFPIVPGAAYAVQVAAAHDLLLQGTPVCAAPDLAAGVNLRGHPSPTPGLRCYGWLRALGAGQVSAIARLDPETGRFATCAFAGEGAAAAPVGMDFPILRGEGYRLTAPVGGMLEPPGCR